MSTTLPRSQRYMRLFAYLPLALQPESEDALLIYYGCGVTADSFTHESRLKRVDIVDISKEVFSLADFYSGPFSSNPLRDPRVTTFVKMAVSFSKAARGSTILLQENRRRRRLPVRSISIPKSSFPS